MIISKSFFDTLEPGEESIRTKLIFADKETGLNVWLVDGKAVREQFNEDFIGGGHHYVYDFVPENDIWLENTLVKDEIPFFLLHEMHEENKMRSGAEYQKAHNDASAVELEARKLPQNVKQMIREELTKRKTNITEGRMLCKRKQSKQYLPRNLMIG